MSKDVIVALINNNKLDDLQDYLSAIKEKSELAVNDILSAIPYAKSSKIAFYLLSYLIVLKQYTYEQLIEQINQLSSEFFDDAAVFELQLKLFRFAVLSNYTDTANSFLTQENFEFNYLMLNQVDDTGKPLAQFCFLENKRHALWYLLDKGCDIHQTNGQNQSLYALARSEKDKHPELMRIIIQMRVKPYPNYLFDSYSEIEPALKVSTSLLVLKENIANIASVNKRTIFQEAIYKQDDQTLRILLNHVKKLIIEKTEVANKVTFLPAEQIRECHFTLEHCLELYTNGNEQVKAIFNESGLNLIAMQPYEILAMPQSHGEELLFKQGVLNFLSEYQGRRIRPLIVPSLSALCLPYVREQMHKNRVGLLPTIIEKAILASDNNEYLNHRRQQRELGRVTGVEKLIEKREYNAHQNDEENKHRREREKKAAEIAAQALFDVQNNLNEFYPKIFEIISEVTKINNARNQAKIKLDKYGLAATLGTLSAAYVFACIMISKLHDDKYKNFRDDLLLCLGVYFFEFMLIGFLNGLFFHNRNNIDDRMLEFGQLPIATQDKISTLMQQLQAFNLNIVIEPDCKVEYLITHLHSCAFEMQQRLALANIVQNTLAYPARISYPWQQLLSNEEFSEKIFMLWGSLLILQAVVSLFIGFNNHPYEGDDPRMIDKLWLAGAATFLTLPLYFFAKLIEEQVRKTTATANIGPKLTRLYDNAINNSCLGSQGRPQQILGEDTDIEMQVLRPLIN